MGQLPWERACEACNRSPQEGSGRIDRLFFKLLLSQGAERNRHPTFSHDAGHESLNSTALQQNPVSHSNRRLDENASTPATMASIQRAEFELGGLFKFPLRIALRQTVSASTPHDVPLP